MESIHAMIFSSISSILSIISVIQLFQVYSTNSIYTALLALLSLQHIQRLILSLCFYLLNFPLGTNHCCGEYSVKQTSLSGDKQGSKLNTENVHAFQLH
mmetsp:Transcript_4804/g.8383  ORF Transcript_4804/g.8383 Transcript_4804/m.8383 type:complete len:99 (+) Transcript_4804:763-1059(+)